jgi:hypothetical protein
MKDDLVTKILELNAAGLAAYQQACQEGEVVLAHKLLELGRESNRCLSIALKRTKQEGAAL